MSLKLKNELLELNIFEENQYFDLYVKLIEKNKYREKDRYKTQSHHIIPKYYFKHLNIKVNDLQSNKVNLLYSDHVLAHYYLALCSKNKLDVYANVAFLKRVIKTYSSIYQVNNVDISQYQRLYEEYKIINDEKIKIRRKQFLIEKEIKLKQWIKEKHICEHCGKIMTEKYGKGKYCCKSCAMTRKHTDETKNKLRILNASGICGRKGKKTSNEVRKKQSESALNYHKKNKFMWINKDGRDKRIDPLILQDYLNDDWKLGRVKGRQTAWNKGLNVNDPRVKKNIERRNDTMIKKYGTLNPYEVKRKRLK